MGSVLKVAGAKSTICIGLERSTRFNCLKLSRRIVWRFGGRKTTACLSAARCVENATTALWDEFYDFGVT